MIRTETNTQRNTRPNWPFVISQDRPIDSTGPAPDRSRTGASPMRKPATR